MKNNLLPIAKPPWTKLGKHLESACRKALFDFSMIEEDKIAIALSGGKDSLTLLYLLDAIKGRGFIDFSIYAIFVEGEFTCGAGINVTFLEAICRQMGITFIKKKSTQKLETLACYRCSRERRKLIFDAAKEVGAKTIAFGHHRDDSIETLLLNLLHKAEFAANLPKIKMADYGVTIIRPLIYIEEKDIINFSKSNGFLRISCQCPVGQNSHRKKTAKIIEFLEKDFPNARVNLAKASLTYGSKKANKI